MVTGLLLAGCADSPPVRVTVAEAPMVAPVAPGPAPEFNVRVARPLPLPSRPTLSALPVVPAPPALTAFTPLPEPEPPTLGAPLPAIAPPAPIAPHASIPLAIPAAPPTEPNSASEPASPPAPAPAASAPTSSSASASPSAPASAAPALPRQTASLPTGLGTGRGTNNGTPAVSHPSTRVVFPSESAALPDMAASMLKPVVTMMTETPELRLQVRAYAEGSTDDPIAARKLSLARALAVRTFLADQGIASTRIDIRALGIPNDTSDPDRVDLVPQE